MLKPFLSNIESLFQITKADYYSDAEATLQPGLKASMQHESAAILHLIFSHYEEAALLLCRSAGSSLEHFFDGVVQRKIEESILFFRHAGYAAMDEKLPGLLISVQFDSYRRIVAECADRKTAEKYMDALTVYHYGGWSAFFRVS